MVKNIIVLFLMIGITVFAQVSETTKLATKKLVLAFQTMNQGTYSALQTTVLYNVDGTMEDDQRVRNHTLIEQLGNVDIQKVRRRTWQYCEGEESVKDWKLYADGNLYMILETGAKGIGRQAVAVPQRINEKKIGKDSYFVDDRAVMPTYKTGFICWDAQIEPCSFGKYSALKITFWEPIGKDMEEKSACPRENWQISREYIIDKTSNFIYSDVLYMADRSKQITTFNQVRMKCKFNLKHFDVPEDAALHQCNNYDEAIDLFYKLKKENNLKVHDSWAKKERKPLDWTFGLGFLRFSLIAGAVILLSAACIIKTFRKK